MPGRLGLWPTYNAASVKEKAGRFHGMSPTTYSASSFQARHITVFEPAPFTLTSSDL